MILPIEISMRPMKINITETKHMIRKMLLVTVGVVVATAIAGCKKGG